MSTLKSHLMETVGPEKDLVGLYSNHRRPSVHFYNTWLFQMLRAWYDSSEIAFRRVLHVFMSHSVCLSVAWMVKKMMMDRWRADDRTLCEDTWHVEEILFRVEIPPCPRHLRFLWALTRSLSPLLSCLAPLHGSLNWSKSSSGNSETFTAHEGCRGTCG